MQWTQRRISWYYRAGLHSQYPGKVLDIIKPYLKKEDELLDLGGGPGLFALKLSPLIRQYHCLDTHPLPLKALRKRAREQGQRNITTYKGFWPREHPGVQVDITMAAFTTGPMLQEKESLERMVTTSRRQLFLIVPGQVEKTTFHWPKRGRLPQNSPCTNTLQILKELKLTHELHLLDLDFGQPVHNKKEGLDFLVKQLKIPFKEARSHFFQIAQPYKGGYYLPNSRQTAVILVQL